MWSFGLIDDSLDMFGCGVVNFDVFVEFEDVSEGIGIEIRIFCFGLSFVCINGIVLLVFGFFVWKYYYLVIVFCYFINGYYFFVNKSFV